MPLAIIVEFEIDPDHVEAFDRLIRANAAASLACEPGCWCFDVLGAEDDPTRYTLYELYADARAFELHLESAHFRAFAAATDPMIKARSIRRLAAPEATDRRSREATVSQHSLKAFTATRDLKVGHFIVEFSSPGIGHILKNAGCDYAVIDMEHSGFGFETVKNTIRFCEAGGLPTIVRTPSRDYHHLARACDIGADGVMVPMVSTVAEARAVINAVKYVPAGRRGVAPGLAHDRYTTGPTNEKLAAANRHMAVFLQIETAEGVRNVSEIAAVEGVDCLWLGHFDLSCSLGIPGEFEHPTFKAAVEEIIAACRRHNLSLGRLAGDVGSAVELCRAGFDFVSFAGDAWVYQAAVTAGVAAIRAGAQALPERRERENVR